MCRKRRHVRSACQRGIMTISDFPPDLGSSLMLFFPHLQMFSYSGIVLSVLYGAHSRPPHSRIRAPFIHLIIILHGNVDEMRTHSRCFSRISHGLKRKGRHLKRQKNGGPRIDEHDTVHAANNKWFEKLSSLNRFRDRGWSCKIIVSSNL